MDPLPVSQLCFWITQQPLKRLRLLPVLIQFGRMFCEGNLAEIVDLFSSIFFFLDLYYYIVLHSYCKL